jgi:drug/metabolite transporter (DMT)-like permease
MSCGVAYTMQIVAQKYTEPAVASLLLSLESVFAALAGAVVLSEVLSGRELTGCIIMFAAIILAQLPERKHQ